MLLRSRVDTPAPQAERKAPPIPATRRRSNMPRIVPRRAQAGVEDIRPVTVVTWIVASLWIPLLVAATVRMRAGNWWAAVFPLGMPRRRLRPLSKRAGTR